MPDRLRRIPTVVSLDATPLQFDEFAAEYDHAVSNQRIERLKFRANQRCFERARHVVTWSDWAKQGVVDGYAISAAKVTVIPPGVTPAIWRRADERRPGDRGVRVLFVGGDLERKGGLELIDAVQRLRHEHESAADGVDVQLDLVTRADVAAAPGINVHQGLTPNSPELVALYHRADICALPTKADCLGLALLEGAAAGLPLVSTTIAGIPEIVVDGTTGLTVPPGDAQSLAVALDRLIDDEGLRRRLGTAAAERVSSRFDAEVNTRRLVDLVVDVTEQARTAG
jgi:glycosyltransferase involved in cell wall biosynthesis